MSMYAVSMNASMLYVLGGPCVCTYCTVMCTLCVQVVNHSVSNVEFEWLGMESVEGAHISVEPETGSVGTYVHIYVHVL